MEFKVNSPCVQGPSAERDRIPPGRGSRDPAGRPRGNWGDQGATGVKWEQNGSEGWRCPGTQPPPHLLGPANHSRGSSPRGERPPRVTPVLWGPPRPPFPAKPAWIRAVCQAGWCGPCRSWDLRAFSSPSRPGPGSGEDPTLSRPQHPLFLTKGRRNPPTVLGKRGEDEHTFPHGYPRRRISVSC